jgi:hypothetical protein
MSFGLRQQSTAKRRETCAARLAMGWLVSVGAGDVCVSLVAASDGKEVAAIRKELARIRARLEATGFHEMAREHFAVKLELCLASPLAASRLRRSVLDKLAPGRVGGDLLSHAIATVERSIREAALDHRVRLFNRVERDRRIDEEMMR